MTTPELPERASPGLDAGPPLREEVLARRQALEAEIKRLREDADRAKKDAQRRSAAIKALGFLTDEPTWSDPKRLRAALARAERMLDPEAAKSMALDGFLIRLREHVADAPQRIRRQLGIALQEACRKRGLGFHVVSREDPVEVRIPPFAVVIDFGKGRAELRFARDAVATAPLTAEAILAAREKAMRELDSSFEATEFFGRCRKAYLQALADRGGREGDRVEILEFLPYLALQHQSKRFRANPKSDHYHSYGKAQFAYDILRLGKASGLTTGARRLNLGVATGTTASDKSRVVYIEDERGQGEYKLTIFFTTADEGGTP